MLLFWRSGGMILKRNLRPLGPGRQCYPFQTPKSWVPAGTTSKAGEERSRKRRAYAVYPRYCFPYRWMFNWLDLHPCLPSVSVGISGLRRGLGHTFTQSAGEVAKVAIIAAVAPDISASHPQEGENKPHPETSREVGTPHSGRTNLAIHQSHPHHCSSSA